MLKKDWPRSQESWSFIPAPAPPLTGLQANDLPSMGLCCFNCQKGIVKNFSQFSLFAATFFMGEQYSDEILWTEKHFFFLFFLYSLPSVMRVGVEKKKTAVKRFIQPFLNRSSGWYFCWLLKYITNHNLEKVPKQLQAFLLNLDTSLGLTLQLILNN